MYSIKKKIKLVINCLHESHVNDCDSVLKKEVFTNLYQHIILFLVGFKGVKAYSKNMSMEERRVQLLADFICYFYKYLVISSH